MKKAASERWVDDPPFTIGPATVQLDGYYISELRFGVGESLAKRAKYTIGTGLHIQHRDVMVCPPVGINFAVEFAQNKKDASRFKVRLQVHSDEAGKDDPYTFDIHLVGYFSVEDGMESFPGLDIFVHRNAVMILYSTAREIIASVTSRGPFPALILPTLSFSVTDKAKAAIRAEAEATRKALAMKKQPSQLPPAERPSKKKTSKKGAKK